MFFSSSFRHPIEYHRNNITKKSRDHIIHSYVGTVAIAALIFCIPKFFESKVIGITEKKMTLDTISNISEMVSDDITFYPMNKILYPIKSYLNYWMFSHLQINHTQYKVDFSDLRFNRYYVLVYNIAIKQLVTGKNIRCILKWISRL